jgi:hypothetical protein
LDTVTAGSAEGQWRETAAVKEQHSLFPARECFFNLCEQDRRQKSARIGWKLAQVERSDAWERCTSESDRQV